MRKLDELAAKLHSLYQSEAKQQGDVRHHDDYEQLPENVKEFDRVLARYILEREANLIERVEELERERQPETIKGDIVNPYDADGIPIEGAVAKRELKKTRELLEFYRELAELCLGLTYLSPHELIKQARVCEAKARELREMDK